MNWDAISASAEVVGTAAVLVTLIYMAVQLRVANKQGEIETLRHNWDGLNRICELIGESPEKAALLQRGRASLDSLSEEEQLVFEMLHIRFLNTIEAWFLQLMETSPPGDYRDQQLENIGGVVVYLFNYPGSLQIWEKVSDMFVPIQDVFGRAIAEAKAA